jgi:uncharacterized membrane protein YdcZ (DUF606 family)
MSVNVSRISNRTAWISYAALEVVLFLLASVTAKSSSHPGTVSNVFWSAFIVGLALGAVVLAFSLVRSRRRSS